MSTGYNRTGHAIPDDFLADYYFYLALKAGWRWGDSLEELFVTVRGVMVNTYLIEKDLIDMESKRGK